MNQNLNVNVAMCVRVTEAEELSRLIEGARYQLKLLPNKSLTLWLLFTARKEATYNFELPISLLGYGFSVAGLPRPTHMLADSPAVACTVSCAAQVLTCNVSYCLMLSWYIIPYCDTVTHTLPRFLGCPAYLYVTAVITKIVPTLATLAARGYKAGGLARWCDHLHLSAGVSAVNRTITARAVEARLSLSKTMLDFGSQIVVRSNQVKPPYSLDVLLTSNEEGDIAWQMGLPSCEGLEGCGGVFAMEPNSGTLAKVSLSDLLRQISTHAWLNNCLALPQYWSATLAVSYCGVFRYMGHGAHHCKLPIMEATSIAHLDGALKIASCVFLTLLHCEVSC